jgi:hypothetical protein
MVLLNSAFDGKRPHLYVSDPEIVKAILVKEFENFSDHRVYIHMLQLTSVMFDLIFVLEQDSSCSLQQLKMI